MLRNRLFLLLSLTILLAVSFAYFTKEEKVQAVKNEKEEVMEIQEKREEMVARVDQQSFLLEQKDQIRRFFSKGMDKFPFVKTIQYTSRVDWLKGRPAWLADFARHYNTSKHFIARSLNGRNDYTSQHVAPGDQFNVFDSEYDISFHLLVNLSTCTLDFSYKDEATGKIEFIKRYQVGVGREDSYSPSGSLTPLGKYKLGEKIAVYREGTESYYLKKKTHMIEVFGTRWIPFSEEIAGCTDSAKGYGLHGVPFIFNQEKDCYEEDLARLGKRTSDGCVHLAQKDIQEIFAIVITKPTYVEIVKDTPREQTSASTE